MADRDDFTPRLGHMRSTKARRAARYLHLVIAAMILARGGSRAPSARPVPGAKLSRGSGVGRVLATRGDLAAFRARRVIVKGASCGLAAKGPRRRAPIPASMTAAFPNTRPVRRTAIRRDRTCDRPGLDRSHQPWEPAHFPLPDCCDGFFRASLDYVSNQCVGAFPGKGDRGGSTDTRTPARNIADDRVRALPAATPPLSCSLFLTQRWRYAIRI